MINETRLTDRFLELVKIDSESFCEREMADRVRACLEELGLDVWEDGAAKRMGHENPCSAGNLYGRLPGNKPGDPVLFCAHLDTVSPGVGKNPIREGDRIHSDETTVLGADDLTGVASILEALTVIRERNLPHPDIEVLLPVAEEPYCVGTRYMEPDRLTSKAAYVLDLTGPVGTAALAAPSILSVTAEVYGKAAHAGFHPEDGINALNIAAKALTRIPTGHLGSDTTVNFGVISGGTGKNIVPDHICIRGEIRSMSHASACRVFDTVQGIFQKTANSMGGRAEVSSIEEIRAYTIDESDPVVTRLRNAMNRLGYGEPILTTTFGGSDNNNLNLHGIHGIVLANAMEKVHSVYEETSVSQMVKATALVLELMQGSACQDQ